MFTIGIGIYNTFLAYVYAPIMQLICVLINFLLSSHHFIYWSLLPNLPTFLYPLDSRAITINYINV